MPRLLLIDDMASIRALLKVYLMEFGFTFAEAVNGREGLAAARASQPDLIIVDLQMPVMDGVEFLHALRQLPALASIPVIVLSADEKEMQRLSSDPVPHTFVTRKPIEPSALKGVVREALRLG